MASLVLDLGLIVFSSSIGQIVGLTIPPKRWTTSIEGKPSLCYYYPEIKIVDPSGFELVTVSIEFIQKACRSLSRSSVFSF